MSVIKKILIASASVVAFGVGGVVFALSNPGNDMLVKPYIQTILDENIEIPVTLQELRLSFSNYKSKVVLEDGSYIFKEGTYSLFDQTVDGTFDVNIIEMGNFEKLIGQKLNGPLMAKGTLKGGQESLQVSGESTLFDSQTTFDVDLADLFPKTALIEIKNAQIEKALVFLNQPVYASGVANIRSDITPKDKKTIAGTVELDVANGKLFEKVLKESLGIDIPENVTFTADSKTAIDGDATNTALNLKSKIANITIKKALFDIKTQQIKSDYTLQVLNITLPNIAMTDPITASGEIEGTPDDLAVKLNTDIFGSKSVIGTRLVKSEPQDVVYDIQKASIYKMLSFVKQPEYAKGLVSASGTLKNIDLENQSFTTETKIKADITKIDYDMFKSFDPFTVNADVKGSPKDLAVAVTSTIFDGKTDLKTNLKDFNPAKVDFSTANLSIQKTLAFAGQPVFATGTLNAKGSISGTDPKNLNGKVSVSKTAIKMNPKAINEAFDLKMTEPFTFNLNTDTAFANGLVTTAVNIGGDLLDLKTQKTKYNLANGSYATDYDLLLKDLGKLEFITGTKLSGQLPLKGTVKKSKPAIATVYSKSLGGETTIRFNDFLLDATLKNIQATELAKMLSQQKIMKGGVINITSKLNMQGDDPIRAMTGDVTLLADQLKINDYDINKMISGFKNTQSVNLLDVGAFVLAGPLGTALTKGMDAGGAASGSTGGQTIIRKMVADLNFQKGVGFTRDVALTTDKYRIAANGRVDMPSQQFQDFYVGILNKEGCADIKQRITGTLSSPGVETAEVVAGAVTNLLGSLLSPVKKLAQAKCTPFYQGSVAHP